MRRQQGSIMKAAGILRAAVFATAFWAVISLAWCSMTHAQGGPGPAPCTNCAKVNVAQTFTASQRGAVATLTLSTSTFTPNFNTAQNFAATLVHASCPCTMANPSTTPVAGQSGMIAVTQSVSGSDLIGTWGSFYKFAGGTAPTLSTGASNVDYLPYYVATSGLIIVGGAILNAH